MPRPGGHRYPSDCPSDRIQNGQSDQSHESRPPPVVDAIRISVPYLSQWPSDLKQTGIQDNNKENHVLQTTSLEYTKMNQVKIMENFENGENQCNKSKLIKINGN